MKIVTVDPLASDAVCTLGDEPTLYLGDSEESEEQWFTRLLGVARLSDGSVAVADDYSTEVRIFDPSGTHVRSNYYLGPWFDANPSIDAEGRTIVIAGGRDPEVRVLDDGMRLRLIIRWNQPGAEVTAADIRKHRETARRRALEDGEISEYEEANLSPKRPAADVFPAVHSVRAGVDGSVWVYRYRKPGETGPMQMVFGPDGDFVCHLATKDDYGIWEAGADYVLGVHTTELGVQHVAMYDLERPVPPPD